MLAICNSILNDIQIRYGLSLIVVFVGSYRRSTSFSFRMLAVFLALYLAYGMKQIAFIFLSVASNTALLVAGGRIINEYVLIVVNLIILYSFKHYKYVIDPCIQTTYDISGFLMLMVIKMSYLGKEFYMEKKKASEAASISPNTTDSPISKDRPSSEPSQPVCVMDALDYILFIPGILSGPTPTFSEYMKYRENCRAASFPFLKTCKSLLFLAIYTRFIGLPFQSWILDPAMHPIKRFLFLYLYNIVLRMKFHFIWSFADCCFLMNGFDGLLNIDFYKVELTTSNREISANWNKFVSRWLKIMFYNRLKQRSAIGAVLLTYLFSSLLHGLNTCYLIFFTMMAVFGPTVARFNSYVQLRILQQLQMIGFITFVSMPFYLLDVKRTYLIWKAVYFYGLIYPTALAILFLMIDIIRGREKHQPINSQAKNK